LVKNLAWLTIFNTIFFFGGGAPCRRQWVKIIQSDNRRRIEYWPQKKRTPIMRVCRAADWTATPTGDTAARMNNAFAH